MAQSRTLKLSLLADLSQFGKGLAKAGAETKSFSTKIGTYARRAAAGFTALGVAAGLAAVRIGVDAVKAAVEDEASQVKLAKALRNTAKASDATIKSTEKWITAQQMAYGISDMKLRPALANLTRATKDVNEAQRLTNLAMDISAGTGRDLETVSIALAKAYGGNVGALKKLGIPLDDNIVKTKDFDAATQVLSETFSGSAAAATDTFEGKVRILNERFGEMRESIGAKLIPWLTRLVTAISEVADGFGGKTGLAKRVGAASDALSAARDEKYEDSWYNVGEALKNVSEALGTFGNTDQKNGANTIKNTADALNTLAGAIRNVNNAWNKARKAQFFLSDLLFGPEPGTGYGWRPGDPLPGKAVGGSVRPGTAYRVGEFGPETLVMGNTGGRILSKGQGAGGGNTFIFNGVIDGESARRSIERLLQNSSRRTGPINLVGGTL